MREVEKEHSGENMSKYLINVIKEYDIEKNLGYIVMDNAPDNDTIIAAFSRALRYKYRINYNPIYHCLYC
jgi:hypothetical protein